MYNVPVCIHVQINMKFTVKIHLFNIHKINIVQMVTCNDYERLNFELTSEKKNPLSKGLFFLSAENS